MGKDILMRHCRLYVDEYDLSGDARMMDSLGNSVAEIDLTGWSNAHKNYAENYSKEIGIRGFQALLNDDASGAFGVLKNAGDHYVSMAFGTGGTPTIGDRAYLMSSAQVAAPVNIDDQKAVIQADLLSKVDRNPVGHVLSGPVSLSSTTTMASINNGAASENGYHAILHLIAVGTSAVWSFKIDDSADGVSWAAVKTFTLTGDAIGCEYVTGTGEVRQYVRFTTTKISGGNVTPVVTFARL